MSDTSTMLSNEPGGETLPMSTAKKARHLRMNRDSLWGENILNSMRDNITDEPNK